MENHYKNYYIQQLLIIVLKQDYESHHENYQTHRRKFLMYLLRVRLISLYSKHIEQVQDEYIR